MNLNKLIFTENACYKAGRKITVKGIMVHSTGANNPWLKRYVGPDDGKLGKNQYNNHWNTSKGCDPGVASGSLLGVTQFRYLRPTSTRSTRKRWSFVRTFASSTV